MNHDQMMKIKNFKYLNQNALKGKILFTGSSLMEMFPVCEIAKSQGINQVIYNRGVGGLNTDEFLENIDILLLDLAPSKIFINIGTNDITKERFGDQWMTHLMDNFGKIIKMTKDSLPDAKIYIMAFYPANLHLPWQTEESIQWMKFRTPENLAHCNEQLKEIAEKYGCHYLDCNAELVDANGEQKEEYAIDGVHMYANGYLNVFKVIKPYLQQKMNFRKIDESNYWDCMELEVDKSQEHFVADNKRSLVEAAFEEGLYTLGIYQGETMVGFILYDYDETFPGWSLSRFMIGKQYQGKGYGKKAVLEFLDYFKKKHNADKIYISVSLDNAIARKMYSDIGFQEIKEIAYTFSGMNFQEMQMVKEL